MSQFIFKMPDIGEGIVEAEVIEWHVDVGDEVKRDGRLADVMTDKATVEMTSPVDGVVEALGCGTGEKIVIGAEFVVFNTTAAGSEKGTAAQVAEESRTGQDKPVSVPAPTPPAIQTVTASVEKPRLRIAPGREDSVSGSGEEKPPKPLASPAVRRRALALGIPLSEIKGSGEKGRVLLSDLPEIQPVSDKRPSDQSVVQATDQSSHLQSPGREIPITGLRRVIADRMSEAKRLIPHFTYVEEFDVTELESTRQYLNSERDALQQKLSLLHFMMLGICRCIKQWPQCNAHYDDERGVLTEFEDVHIGVATMTESGLVVPVIRNADKMDIWTLADQVHALAELARAGQLKREQLSGSTITVTSLGPLAGIATTPIINRPETAIIGPNKMTEKLLRVEGAVVTRRVMNVSSSFDHRIVDGYDAAMMVQRLRGLLENPAALFA